MTPVNSMMASDLLYFIYYKMCPYERWWWSAVAMGNQILLHEIKSKSKTASDFWIEYDKPRFEENEIFKDLINEIQNIKEL